jgi:transposase
MRTMLDAGRADEMIAAVTALVDEMAESHARVLFGLKQALKHRYGRRSEKLVSDEQLRLVYEGMLAEAQREAPEAAAPEASSPALEVDEGQPRGEGSPQRERRKQRGRRPFSPGLPREEIVIPVPEAELHCPGCGQERAVIGHDESERLEYVPASFVVKRIRRERRACPRCRDAVVRAPVPPQLVERGALCEGLLAQVLVAKYKDHLPLYRQRQIYRRQGVDLPRSTLGDAVAASAFSLRPLAERIGERVRAAPIVQTDDTGIRVLDRDAPGNIKRGILWPYVAEERLAAFVYTPTREGKFPKAWLEGYRGYLQVDGYSGYDALFAGEACPRIEVGCWAHARRYFVRALDAGDDRALEPIAWVQGLYRLESQAQQEALAPAGRAARRQEQARPILDELAAWLETMHERVAPKSPLGRAIGYTRGRWPALLRYLEDGRLEIDNNRVERLVRLVAVGRKNYLFAGSDAGAERAAVLYTMIATCTLHELDPWAYLRDVLEKLAAGWLQREIDALLPDRWRLEHPEALRCERPA